MHVSVSYDRPDVECRPGVKPRTRDAIGGAIDAGFRHIVLGLPAPYPAGGARWVADELIAPPRAP